MCKIFSNIPIFMAICTIERWKKKSLSTVKHKSYQKILYRDYLFSEQTEPVNELKKPIENDFEKVMLYKWTGTCERCYQRGHKPVNCTAPKRNKKFVE